MKPREKQRLNWHTSLFRYMYRSSIAECPMASPCSVECPIKAMVYHSKFQLHTKIQYRTVSTYCKKKEHVYRGPQYQQIKHHSGNISLCNDIYDSSRVQPNYLFLYSKPNADCHHRETVWKWTYSISTLIRHPFQSEGIRKPS